MKTISLVFNVKKFVLIVFLVLSLGAAPLVASAGTFVFSPNDRSGETADVFDLDHHFLYLWAIAATPELQNALNDGEVIVSANIMIDDIYNWDKNSYALKFFLLDNVKRNDTSDSVDIISISDNQSESAANEIPHYNGTKFQSYIELEKIVYTKANGTTPNPIPGPDQDPIDLKYEFDANELSTLAKYLDSPNIWGSRTKLSTFGIGFDPDCHFFNTGISLTIETQHTPEPATMLLFGTGIAGLAALRRRKKV